LQTGLVVFPRTYYTALLIDLAHQVRGHDVDKLTGSDDRGLLPESRIMTYIAGTNVRSRSGGLSGRFGASRTSDPQKVYGNSFCSLKPRGFRDGEPEYGAL